MTIYLLPSLLQLLKLVSSFLVSKRQSMLIKRIKTKQKILQGSAKARRNLTGATQYTLTLGDYIGP